MLDLQIVLIPIFWTFKPFFLIWNQILDLFTILPKHVLTSKLVVIENWNDLVCSLCVLTLLYVILSIWMNWMNDWSFKMICPWNVKFLKENIICLTNRTIHQSTSYRFVRNVFTLSNKRTRKRDFKFKYTRWLNPSYI